MVFSCSLLHPSKNEDENEKLGGFLALQLKKNSIFIVFYQSILLKAGCFSSSFPKDGNFQSWALVLFCIENNLSNRKYANAQL